MTDLNVFTRKIKISSPIKTVYTAWCTQRGLETWFLRKAEFRSAEGELRMTGERCNEGDIYFWLWHGYSDDVHENRKVLSVNGSDRIKFEFSAGTIVEVVLSEERSATLLTLTQTNFPADPEKRIDYYVGCSTGWTFYLANLKSVLEGGIDLRNKELSVENAINA